MQELFTTETHTRELSSNELFMYLLAQPAAPAQLLERLRTNAAQPHVARTLLHALSHEPVVARHAYWLALELGAPLGDALARILPAAVERFERHTPENAQALKQLDSGLCLAFELVERLAPAHLPNLYRQLIQQRGAAGKAPWWTFRAWQRLTTALQRQIAAGNVPAMDLVLELLARGAAAEPGSAAHWRGSWAAYQLVPHLPGLNPVAQKSAVAA